MIIVQIAGHLGQDPEVRFTPSGQKLTILRVATNYRRGDKEKTVWWRVTIWGDRLDKRLSYLRKGSAVFVTGEMSPPEIYTDKNGAQQVSLEITGEMVSLNPFGRGSGAPKPQNETQGQGEQGEQGEGSGMSSFRSAGVMAGSGQANISEDDIPF